MPPIDLTHQPFTRAAEFDGRENLRRLGDALYAKASSPGGNFKSGDDLIRNIQDLGSGCGELASGYPFRVRVYAPNDFVDKEKLGVVADPAKVNRIDLQETLPTLHMHLGGVDQAVKFYELCLALSREGIRFIAQADSQGARGAPEKLQELYQRGKPIGFIVF